MNDNQNNRVNNQYRFDLETGAFQSNMKELENNTRRFGSLFSNVMAGAVKNGKGFDEILKSLAMRMSGLAMSQAFRPLENMLSSGLGSLFSGLSSGLSSTFSRPGAVGAPINITPFAKGGVVGTPNFFSFAGRMGVMGERGAEAILPLARGSDGRLGVAAPGGNGAGNASITFNVMANDVSGFRKSEGQISAMLARAVSRGQGRL